MKVLCLFHTIILVINLDRSEKFPFLLYYQLCNLLLNMLVYFNLYNNKIASMKFQFCLRKIYVLTLLSLWKDMCDCGKMRAFNGNSYMCC